MATMFMSLIASKIILKEISMMLKISAVMVAIMGGLTLYFENDTFFKMKPTLVNSILGTILLVGYFKKKAFLKIVFEAGFPPMEQKGWLLLSRNIALWYFAFAILNEFIWRNFTLEQWMWSKLWVSIPLSFIMMAFQVPVMQKYMLPEEEPEEITETEEKK
jgi:intracellular septation protein